MTNVSLRINQEDMEYLQELWGKEDVLIFQKIDQNVRNGEKLCKQKITNDEKKSYLRVLRSLNFMIKAKEKWWLSTDIRLLAYKQIQETTIMIPIETFKKGVEEIIGIPFEEENFDYMKKLVISRY